MIIEWNADKEAQNQKKHGIGFEEARTVFNDDFAKFMVDIEHSEVEDRFLLLGMSLKLRILVVCHCYRESDEILRIISARKATQNETRQYLEGRK